MTAPSAGALALTHPWQELQLASGDPQALVDKLEGHHAAYPKLWYQLYKTNMVEEPNFGGNSTGGAWRSRTNAGGPSCRLKVTLMV